MYTFKTPNSNNKKSQILVFQVLEKGLTLFPLWSFNTAISVPNSERIGPIFQHVSELMSQLVRLLLTVNTRHGTGSSPLAYPIHFISTIYPVLYQFSAVSIYPSAEINSLIVRAE